MEAKPPKIKRCQTWVRNTDKAEAVIRSMAKGFVLLWMLDSPDSVEVSKEILLRDWTLKGQR